ncbi:hypothetical protein D3C87_1971700 [compost metagenome]
MTPDASPEAVVQRQLAAYNAKDLDAWLATYAEDAKQFELAGKLLAAGHAELRARTAFALPSLTFMHACCSARSWGMSLSITRW